MSGRRNVQEEGALLPADEAFADTSCFGSLMETFVGRRDAAWTRGLYLAVQAASFALAIVAVVVISFTLESSTNKPISKPGSFEGIVAYSEHGDKTCYIVPTRVRSQDRTALNEMIAEYVDDCNAMENYYCAAYFKLFNSSLYLERFVIEGFEDIPQYQETLARQFSDAFYGTIATIDQEGDIVAAWAFHDIITDAEQQAVDADLLQANALLDDEFDNIESVYLAGFPTEYVYNSIEDNMSNCYKTEKGGSFHFFTIVVTYFIFIYFAIFLVATGMTVVVLRHYANNEGRSYRSPTAY